MTLAAVTAGTYRPGRTYGNTARATVIPDASSLAIDRRADGQKHTTHCRVSGCYASGWSLNTGLLRAFAADAPLSGSPPRVLAPCSATRQSPAAPLPILKAPYQVEHIFLGYVPRQTHRQIGHSGQAGRGKASTFSTPCVAHKTGVATPGGHALRLNSMQNAYSALPASLSSLLSGESIAFFAFTMPLLVRTAWRISSARSLFSVRKNLAFSRPWPSRVLL